MPAGTELDVFRLDVARDGTNVKVRSLGTTDTYGRLRDSSLAELAMDDNGGADDNFQIEMPLDAGIYYVEVGGHEDGNYRVIASGDADQTCSCARAPEMIVDHGGTNETATLLAIGPPSAGIIADGSDTDVFRIDLNGGATLSLGTRGPSDTRGELLDGLGASLGSDDNTGPDGNFLITATIDPGVYYLEVTGDGGESAVSAQLAEAGDQGGTAATSALLTLYGQEDLDRVRPQVLLSSAGRIDSAFDLDVFRLDVLLNATDLRVRSAGSIDTWARLLDSSLKVLATDDSSGSGENFQIQARLHAGIYYLEVGGSGAGAYSVIASGDSRAPCSCADRNVKP